ncbi:MAG: DUF167 domain-containing protein [Planctomycetaceae bacterium]
MVQIQSTRDGVILPVQARPGAKRDGIIGAHAGRLKVAVTQAPEKGKANQALVEILTEALGLRPSQIVLRSGATGRAKSFLISGAEEATVRARLDGLLRDRAVG